MLVSFTRLQRVFLFLLLLDGRVSSTVVRVTRAVVHLTPSDANSNTATVTPSP